MPAGRLKLVTILAGLALAAAGFLASTQTWVSVRASTPEGGTIDVAAAGSVAAPALSALSLAGLALFGAITIAGRAFRVVLGVLEMILGGCVILSSVLSIADPVSAASSSLTTATGVSGDASVRRLVLSHAVTVWPWVALVAGVLGVLLGLVVVVTSGSWPESAKRYQSVRIVDENAPTDPVAAWDTLSVGADPTAPSEGPSEGVGDSLDPEADDRRPGRTR
jgi:uncharacterized membrane protein (TIGR02234 family)